MGKDKKFRINSEMLPAENVGKIDWSAFIENNWKKKVIVKDKEQHLLWGIDKTQSIGGAIWFNEAGKLMFRRHKNAKANPMDKAQFRLVLESYLNVGSFPVFKSDSQLAANHLRIVEDRFSPFVMSEFYLLTPDGDIMEFEREKIMEGEEPGDGEAHWYRTSFRPTEYLKMKYRANKKFDKPETIMKLIRHLCRENDEYVEWFINWLAGFFQTLRKSQVSLVLRGAQGSGKGILFKEIISKLFGPTFCVVVDSERLDSQFKGWMSDSLFYNLNEVSVDLKSRKGVKNFIKQLVTEDELFMEEKNKTAKVTRIFGNIIVTSNEVLPLDIEPEDRRFTVFKTGKALKNCGWDMDDTREKIATELNDFSLYLKSIKVDWQAYNKPLETPEKEALIESTTGKYEIFIKHLFARNGDYFKYELEDETEMLNTLESFLTRLEKGQAFQAEMLAVFRGIFGDKYKPKSIMKAFRSVDAEVFAQGSIKKDNKGVRYFKLPEDY